MLIIRFNYDTNEFTIDDVDKFHGYEFIINENWLCNRYLGDYSVDKYRITLKRKFHAVKYKRGHIGFSSITEPMVFERIEDAEVALEWVHSLHVNAILNGI